MIDDIKTVLWKEVKEEIFSNKQVLLGLLVTVPVFGVLLPWNMGRSFVEEPYLLIFLSVIPLVMVINYTDGFVRGRTRASYARNTVGHAAFGPCHPVRQNTGRGRLCMGSDDPHNRGRADHDQRSRLDRASYCCFHR